MATTNKVERGFTLTRILDAPREVVYHAWTDPKHLVWFLNDKAVTSYDPIIVDLRVGGVWKLKMVVNEHLEYFTGGIYREIVPGEKLVFTWGAADGWPEIDLDHPDDGPIATVMLNEWAGGEKTEMTFHLELPEDMSQERVSDLLSSACREGWSETLDRLVASVAHASRSN